MAESLPESTPMTTNMMFAGMEDSRAIANYIKQNAREAAHTLQIQLEYLPRLQKKQFKF
jgi:hypothetical protein